MSETAGQFERMIALGERALAHIRSHRTAAHPRGYEFWYTYVSGKAPSLARAVNDILTRAGKITQAEIDDLYDRFLHANRAAAATQNAAKQFLSEMQEVDNALSAANEGLSGYARTLAKAQSDLGEPINAERLQRLVTDISRQTSEVERANAHLSGRLSQALQEILSLRDRLESMRVETQKDPVTTLLNRESFDVALNEALEKSERTGDVFALLMMDIDFFKAVNDTFGHLTGDRVLRLVAQTVRQNLKGQDVVARFGGEEFVAILPDTDLEAASVVAEKLRVAVMSRELVKRSTGQNLGRVTISIGVARFRPGDTTRAIIARADHNLYSAKRGGRNMAIADDIIIAEDVIESENEQNFAA